MQFHVSDSTSPTSEMLYSDYNHFFNSITELEIEITHCLKCTRFSVACKGPQILNNIDTYLQTSASFNQRVPQK